MDKNIRIAEIASLIHQLSAELAELTGMPNAPIHGPQQPYTSVSVIKQRIEDSVKELRGLYPKPVHIAVLRQWYEDKYELWPGDMQELRQKKGGKNLRWWSQFGNAISNTNVLVSTERNWYAVAPL